MLIEHNGVVPTIDSAAWVAPTAVVSGDVTIGPDSRVLHGAVLTAESGPISIGRECIIMEQAVIRASKRHPVTIADRVLVGPHAYLSGCAVADEAFLAAGTRVFNGARIGAGAEVRINAVVHLLTVIDPGAVVPIGWVAVGDPAQLFPADRHDEIWAVQEPLDFPGVVFGMPRGSTDGSLLATAAPRYARALTRHQQDRIMDGTSPEPDIAEAE